MSRSVDLFIDAPEGLAELASELARLTATCFTPVPDAPIWVLQDGDVLAELSEHRYGNDRNLLLAQFRYCLSVRVPLDGRVDTTGPEVATLRRVLAEVRKTDRYRALLVWDLQHRLDQHNGPSDPTADEPIPVEEPVL